MTTSPVTDNAIAGPEAGQVLPVPFVMPDEAALGQLADYVISSLGGAVASVDPTRGASLGLAPAASPEFFNAASPLPDANAPATPELSPTIAAPPGGSELYILAEAQARRLSAFSPGQAAPPVSVPAVAATPWTSAPEGSDDLRRALCGLEPWLRDASAASRSDPWQPAIPTGIALSSYPAFDVGGVRRDFPILSEYVNGRPLAWFDNGATTQKPQAVIDRLGRFYTRENSNVHRAAHALAARATDAYEDARSTVARFLGAASSEEIVFVRGTTEAINLVAQSLGRQIVGVNDEIVISHLEHHANIVPWQQLAEEKGARLRVIPVDDSGQILLDAYARLLTDKTKIVAISHVSNALGTITPVAAVIEQAHRVGAKVLIDGAQSVSHLRVDVQALDADFYAFSGHKIYGPTGIGVLYGKRDLLNAMPPWQGGGNMITDVTFEKTVFQTTPARFEAGTGNIADGVGLGAALVYFQQIGIENVARYEHDLLQYATRALLAIPGLRLIGTAADKASVLSFVLRGYTPEEVGSALNQEGIAVRAGHHCAQPILRRFGVEGTVRASLAFYNTCEEIDRFIAVLARLSAAKGRLGTS
jgi:cysteine desulfurase / selenocysteine lyase